ncbi:MAG: HAD-IC family P-type ATPase [Planctomycetes bacterium]|nr:HAD-IC family P-type ATPase [Planctomycetota bacterium]
MTVQAWHALPPADALQATGSSAAGLTEDEARARLERDGPNRLTARRGRSALRRFVDQLVQPLIVVLLAAGVVSLLMDDRVDAAVIFGVVLINAVIGFLQEGKAEGAIAALDAMVVTQATVVRGGARRRIPSEQLVLGDVVALQSGDAVPADLRLLAARDLHVEEAALTGESVPSHKDVAAVGADVTVGDRRSMAFAGTAVTYGTCTGVVVATGDRTETGRIAGMIAGAGELVTPLTKRLARLSHLILWIILSAAAGMFALQLARGQPLEDTFSAAVAFAVGAIPEGLPAAVTVLLAVGVSQMARRGAIIRRLPAVETLGSTTVICSDKTGTLTQNQMTVTQVWLPGGAVAVTGAGYDPAGRFERDGQPVDPAAPDLREVVLCAALCQDTRVRRDGTTTTVEGDPTEAALVVMAEKGGLPPEALDPWPRLDAVPFESAHMYMATLHRDPSGGAALYVKGSTEALLPRCKDALGPSGPVPLDADAVHREVAVLAASGLRVLCLARRRWAEERGSVGHEDVRDLTLLGLVGMIDPPRPAAKDAVAVCQRAGIAVKMITGDHAVTAAAIAQELGLEGRRDPEGQLVAVTGAALAKLDEVELSQTAEDVAVFARVAPEQKLELVRALRGRGHVVAMTGDGVNDAPALKQADIGVAMGKGGTDVARGASDMVLTDDDFSTIKAAVEEGRGVYDNLLKFVAWTLPTNGGEGLVILAAVLFGLTLPILPVQILWVNLGTAVLLGLMLIFEPKEPGLMERRPRPVDAPILGRELWVRVALVSVLMAVAGFVLFQWCEQDDPARVAEARTVAVNTIVVIEVGYLFACRSLTLPLWRLGLFSNPWVWVGGAAMLLAQLAWTYLPFMNRLFHTAPIHWTWWLAFTAAGAVVFAVVEAKKVLALRRA